MKLAPIKDKKRVDTIFKKGFLIKEKSLFIKGYDFGEEESFFGVSVSKKLFKSAVDRNKIKRLVKEVLRLNKLILNKELDKRNVSIHVMILFNGKKIPSYNSVEVKIKEILKRLAIGVESYEEK